MLDTLVIPFSNLLPGSKPQRPHEITNHIVHHCGARVLGSLTAEHMCPASFAKDIFNRPPTKAQLKMLHAGGRNQRLNVLTAPATGTTTAGAMLALHRLLTHRNHRVLIISPRRSMFLHCAELMRESDHDLMLDGRILFSVRLTDGFWASEEAEWGVQWLSMEDLPLHHIGHMIANAQTIIIDNAHQYSPDFLRELNRKIAREQQLIVIGKDANRALTEFEQDEAFKTVRLRIDQTWLAHPSYINMKREQYRDYPETYERIFQMPITWVPKPWRA